MDRLINVKISGSHLAKDCKTAGVQGEANVNALRITFDEGWDGYAKKVTFWDAKGKNPVERTLTADLLENAAESVRIYICPIPGEPMAEAGMMTFIVDGWADDKRPRSMSAELEVEYAPVADGANKPADPTPSQVEQLQGEIDKLTDDIQAAAQASRAILGMTVTSEASEAGTEPTAEKQENEDGTLNLHFALPVGAQGPAGPPGPIGPDGKPGPQGERGVSGVYVGSGNMPEGYDVQVDVEGGGMTLDDLIRDALGGVATAKIGEVTLRASAWTGSGHLYSQVVTIDGVTEYSQVDLTPSVQQLVVFYEKDLTFVTENAEGVVTVYAIGQKPTNDYTIQVTITEVSV